MTSKLNITPWYYTVNELCREWEVCPETVYYLMDSGQLTPAALIPKWRLPSTLQVGAAPNVCLILDKYRSLSWSHSDGNAESAIAGEFMAFVIDGEGFKNLRTELTEPTQILRRDLVVLLEQKEQLEENAEPRRKKAINSTERKTLLYIIRALAVAAFRVDVDKPYKIAARVCEQADFLGIQLSDETVARKVKEAIALPV